MKKITAKMYSTIAFACAIMGLSGVAKNAAADQSPMHDNAPLVLTHGAITGIDAPAGHYSHSSHESHSSHVSHYSSRY